MCMLLQNSKKIFVFCMFQTLISFNNQTMCKSTKFFDDPEVYRPERWLRSENAKVAPFIHLPFGQGVRMCIGKRFAEQEIYLATIKVSILL